MQKIDPKDVVFDKRFYPRGEPSPNKIKEYEELLDVLPPIVINQDKILIDGAHRLFAFLNKERAIPYEQVKTIDDDDISLKAIELNARHGFQLTQKEKKNKILEFYGKFVNKEARSFDVARLKQAFSIPDSTFSDWTKDLEERLEGQRLERILALHLQCKTQEEIAKEIGLTQKQVSIKLTDIEEKVKEIYQNPNSEIGIKYSFLKEKCNVLAEFTPKLYNIWNESKLTNDTEHFGSWPIEFMENLLYYYTEPFDIVFDPFAGGGTTIDACKKWFRKYYVSDRKPIETREEIKEWDIANGLPEGLKAPNFVFLDPPYWKQSEGKYSEDKEDLANVSLETFYSSLETFIKELKKRMKPKSYIALVIQGTQWKNKLQLEDHAFKLYKILEKHFEFEQRIICPYSTQQYNAQQVEIAKTEKVMLTLYRDLLIFKRGE